RGKLVVTGPIGVAFRPGLAVVVLLVLVQVGLLVSAWQARRLEGWSGVLGATGAGSVVGLVLMELTAEYMGFAGVCQLFWMMVGTFVLARRERPALAVAAAASPRRPALIFETDRAPALAPGARR